MEERRITLESIGRQYSCTVPAQNLLIDHRPHVEPMADAESAIREALAAPTGTPPLEERARGARNAVVIVDDWARSSATRSHVTPLVLDCLNRAGIPDESITVVMARGLSTVPSVEIIDASFGPRIIERRVRRTVSALNRSGQRFIGITSFGTPVWIDAVVADADLVVGVGSVFASPWGGWSGGAKIIVPGVASAETIHHNHSMMLNDLPGEWDRPGLLDREEMARMAGLDFLVSVVLTAEGKIAAVGAGEFSTLHREMGRRFLDLHSVRLDAKPDVVVTTVDWWRDAPAPMDSLYGFTDHSLTTMRRIADDGATIVLVGNLAGGIMPPVREYSRCDYSLEDLAVLLCQGGALGFLPVLFSIQLKLAKARYRIIAAVDGPSNGTLGDIGFETAPSASEAVAAALQGARPDAAVAVLPALGCPTFPVLGPGVEPPRHAIISNRTAKEGSAR